MSANISIKEGGIGRSFNAAKLRTVQPGGSTVDWVPKSDVERSTIYANENGIYRPASEGVYAFDEVRVNVPEVDSVTGYATDGKLYNYKKTGGSSIEVNEVPDYIVVTTPPTKASYFAGEQIDYSGMVVTAYSRDGESMGVVPSNELILPAQIAQYDWHGDVIEIGAEGLNSPVALCRVIEGTYTTTFAWYIDPYTGKRYDLRYYVSKLEQSDLVYAFVCHAYEGQKASVYVSRKPFSITTRWNAPPAWDQHIGTKNGSETVYAGYTAYVTKPVITNIDYVPTAFVMSARQSIDIRYAAVLALMGGQVVSMSMKVPVQWKRPDDGKVLETDFEIAVKTSN